MKNISHSIIFSGKISSGKSSISKIIARKLNISRVSFSSYLNEICIKKKIETSRENLQNLGEFLINNNPKSFLFNVLDMARNSPVIIIDGVRHNIILDLIKNISNKTTLIYFDLEDKLRQSRYLKRNKKIDVNKSPNLFKEHDKQKVESEVASLRAASDLIIDSNRPIDVIIDQVMGYIATRLKNS